MKFNSRLVIGCITGFAITVKLHSPQLTPSSPNVITICFGLKNVLAQLLTGIITNSPCDPCFFVKTALGPTSFLASPFTTYQCGPSSSCWTATVLDWKWDNSVSPPTKLVLVQWFGLAPKDTPWDSYDALRESYNLVNKVILPGEGDVSNTNPPHTSRPKRCTKRSIYLDDYN